MCVSPAYITISLLRWTLVLISPHRHVRFQAFCLVTSSLPFSSVCERWCSPSSAWHLLIVDDDHHQHHKMGGKVMTPLLEINSAVQQKKKNPRWFAPDLKGKPASIETSISGWLGYRPPGSYEARKRSTNIPYSPQSNFIQWRGGPTALLWEEQNIRRPFSADESSGCTREPHQGGKP